MIRKFILVISAHLTSLAFTRSMSFNGAPMASGLSEPTKFATFLTTSSLVNLHRHQLHQKRQHWRPRLVVQIRLTVKLLALRIFQIHIRARDSLCALMQLPLSRAAVLDFTFRDHNCDAFVERSLIVSSMVKLVQLKMILITLSSFPIRMIVKCKKISWKFQSKFYDISATSCAMMELQ